MLIVGVLLATVLLRFVFVGAVVYLLLPRGGLCPTCGAQTTPVRHWPLRLLAPGIEHRWCLDCGWNGVVRRAPAVADSSVVDRPS